LGKNPANADGKDILLKIWVINEGKKQKTAQTDDTKGPIDYQNDGLYLGRSSLT
jgi:hypothetical protein